jgi:hypothetical protein
MTRRRALIIALVAVLLLFSLPAAMVARVVFFPPKFDVPSIAQRPEYQDPALLAQAWKLPVAAAFGGRVVSQSNGGACGPSSLANTLRSLGRGGADEAMVLDGTGKCRLFGMCLGGLTLDELAEVARKATGREVKVLRDLSMAAFRQELQRANDPSRRLIVNFHRGLLFGRGVGHHSPIGGYLPERDLVFVLDVNGSYGPWLVPASRLYAAQDSVDPASGKKRGLLVIE